MCGRSVGSNVRNGLLYGTGVYSDWFHPSNSSFHMDNMKDTESIIKLYNEHMKGFSNNMDKGEYADAGADLHAIADFYSHSNYVDLYQQFYDSRGESVSATDIKPFSEMMENQDFMNFVEDQGVLFGARLTSPQDLFTGCHTRFGSCSKAVIRSLIG